MSIEEKLERLTEKIEKLEKENKRIEKQNKRIKQKNQQLEKKIESKYKDRSEKGEKGLSRRGFLKKAGAGAAGLGALSLAPTSALKITKNGIDSSSGIGLQNSGSEYFKVNNGGPVEIKNTNLAFGGSTNNKLIRNANDSTNAIQIEQYSLSDTETVEPYNSGESGLIMVHNDSANASALFMWYSGGATTEISDQRGQFGTSEDSGNRIDVYVDSSTNALTIKNNSGGSAKVDVVVMS